MDSIWTDSAHIPAFESLHGDITTDVLVIGGGMAGILCAYWLKASGVDCALVEADGITIVDFKSDHVSEETISSAGRKYMLQLQTYADALSRIYKRPIKAAYLYFFHLNRFITVQ
jgi:2-polyprenyl-6-methoxyphenol hydroxylase-like FAD-dependent oxidoreductase